jgi:hypothetical protein
MWQHANYTANVPEGFLEHGRTYRLSVGAVTGEGNTSLTEAILTTAK